MKIFRKLFHPLITFISIQILWILVLVFWIYWFLGRHSQFKQLAERYQTEWLPDQLDWLILTEGILLLVAILIGIYVIFLYWRRQAALNRAQKHFIHQVTHELKSPLAALQLNLETIRIRKPGAEQLDKLVAMMQGDCERLGGLISNLLAAGRLEHKGARLNLELGNLSAFTERYLSDKQETLPAGARLHWQIEAGLLIHFERESMEMVLRNLLENALTYVDGPAQIDVSLKRQGNTVSLIFRDQGIGIPRAYQKKVFRMFYRLRNQGKARGSGLGLFIIRNIIRLHSGKIWIESSDQEKGTSFHMVFPLSGTTETNDGQADFPAAD